MDIANYTALKEAGSIRNITNNGGGSYTVTSKLFSSQTGEALPDDVAEVSLSGVQTQLDYYTAAAANLNTLITDCNATT